MGEHELLELLATTAANLYRASLNNTEKCRHLFNVMSEVRPGDLVMETTTMWRRGSAHDRLGTLVKVVETEGDRIYHVERLDGTVITWGNASFVKIPREIVVTPTEGAASVPVADRPGQAT